MTVEIDVLDSQHSDLDGAFRRHAFERLRRSGAIRVRDLVEGSPSGRDSAQSTLDALVERGMAIVDDSQLVAIDGLSVRPTRHRTQIGGDELYTWCAADAVGIPAALSADAEVVTACPHCSALIAISLSAGVPKADEELVLWLPTASCSHVVTQFCPEVNFFCIAEHLKAWRSQAGDPEGEMLSADGAAELGRKWWAYLIDDGTA